MTSVLWYVLPLAIAVALSIFPVLAVILLLLSDRAVKGSVAYAVGWTLGILVLVSAFAAIARLIPAAESDQLPTWVHYVEIVVGAVLVAEGTRQAILERRKASVATTPPHWVEVATSLGPGRAFAFGLLMNVRPKNLALTLAAGLAIGAAPITPVAGGGLVLLFTVIGVSTVVGFVVAYLLGRERLRPLLNRLNTWLLSNASLVLKLSVVLIGLLLIAVGISALVTS